MRNTIIFIDIDRVIFSFIDIVDDIETVLTRIFELKGGELVYAFYATG